MARLIEEIILKLGLDLTGVEAGTKRANDSLEDLEDGVDDYGESAEESEKSSKAMGGAILGVAAAAAAATAALGVMIAKNIESQVETITMAEALGVAAQRLHELQNLARVFNAESEDMVQGIKNINESLSEAFAEGSGTKFDLFKELNIDLEKMDSLSPDEQFIEFAKALNNAENQGRRTAIQLAVMGEEGFKLSNTMRALGADSEKALGIVSGKGGNVDSEQLQKFSKTWNELWVSIDGITNVASNSLMEFVNDHSAFALITEHVGQTAKMMTAIDVEGIAGRAKKEALEFEREVSRIGLAPLRNSQEEAAANKEEKRRLAIRLQNQKDEYERGAAQRNFIRDQEIEEERKKNNKIEAERKKQEDRDKKAAQRKLDRQEREKEKALSTIADIGRSRKKERLAELKDRQITGGLSAVEAGSSEAARLAAERSGVNLNERAEIERLEKEIAAEEKAMEEKKLKIAEDSLKQLQKIGGKGTTIIKTKRIN